jgi:hypothetical protein
MTTSVTTIRNLLRAAGLAAALFGALAYPPCARAQAFPGSFTVPWNSDYAWNLTYFNAHWGPGAQTVNGPQPSPVVPLANIMGPGGMLANGIAKVWVVDFISIQCVGCSQAWHVQLFTKGSLPGLTAPTSHSTGFMLIPTPINGVNYGATTLATNIRVEGGSTWELVFSSGAYQAATPSTTIVPSGVYIELWGHIEQL